jgi:two-component system chemotaxis response regulator CheB
MVPDDPIELFVIGASAGGIQALGQVLMPLPRALPATLLIVLHLAQGRPSPLAGILQKDTRLIVRDACDGCAFEAGHAYVAIADHHLTVSPGVLHERATPKERHYRPCVDTLFRSAAEAYGSRVAGIVLSGMLADGTVGLRHISAAGGVTIVQDPDEARVPDMPRNAIAGDHVRYIMRTADIGALIQHLSARAADQDG